MFAIEIYLHDEKHDFRIVMLCVCVYMLYCYCVISELRSSLLKSKVQIFNESSSHYSILPANIGVRWARELPS